jgi:hypothetical protein
LANQLPYRSRRIQGLPLEEEVRNNSPPPMLRHHLDQSNSFIPTGPVKISAMEPLEVNALEPEVVTVEDIEAEEYTLTFNPPLTKTFPSPLVQVRLLDQKFTDSIPLHWAAMDDTPQVSGSRVPTNPTSK